MPTAGAAGPADGWPLGTLAAELAHDDTDARADLMVVLTSDTDWEEIRELVTESYRILAPKKLTALLD